MLISLRVTRPSKAAGQMHFILRLNASKDKAMYRSQSPWHGQWPPADHQCIVTGQGGESRRQRSSHRENSSQSANKLTLSQWQSTLDTEHRLQGRTGKITTHIVEIFIYAWDQISLVTVGAYKKCSLVMWYDCYLENCCYAPDVRMHCMKWWESFPIISNLLQ